MYKHAYISILTSLFRFASTKSDQTFCSLCGVRVRVCGVRVRVRVRTSV